MEDEKDASARQYAKWQAPETGGQYLEELKMKSTNAQLERSKIFRYPKDSEILDNQYSEILLRGDKAKTLIIGIGNLEEPLSYMAIAYQAGKEKGKTIQDVTDLEMVDIRKREEIAPKYGLGKVYESPSGAQLGKAFVTEATRDQFAQKPRQPRAGQENFFELNPESNEYEFKSEIKEFVDHALNDPNRAHLDTPIEKYLVENTEEQADVVACNNVLQHLGGQTQYKSPFKENGLLPENYAEYLKIASSIVEKVKPGGLLIIHTGGSIKEFNPAAENGDEVLKWIPDFTENFEQIRSGVYKRKA